MKSFDFVIVGAGIAGIATYLELKEFNTLIVDEDVLTGASRAAGAFLFPKVGKDSAYTRFINEGIFEAVKYYQELGIDTHTKGVLILPRDEKDIEKFKTYEKELNIPFEKRDGGFFFEIGSVINPEDIKKLELNFRRVKVTKIEKVENYWVINGEIKTKNLILATGHKEIFSIDYFKIRPIWGERIEIKSSQVPSSEFQVLDHYFHKNCSVGKVGGIIKIGATHKRNCLDCKENLEEAKFLIEKANEIVEIKEYELLNIKGGFRAASVDYFPIVGQVIDSERMLKEFPQVVNGRVPKEFIYFEGLYVINGMGGRGFSNAVICAKKLKKKIINGINLGKIDTKRLFIKYARKLDVKSS